MENQYTTTARFYDSLFPKVPQEIDYYEKSMRNGGSVLEVGCGTGGVSLELLKRHRKSRITCVDPSEEMLSLLRTKLGELRTMYGETIKGGIDIVKSTMEEYSPSTTFDLILFPGQTVQVLQKDQICTIINRYLSFLAPRGNLIFTTFDPFTGTKAGTTEKLYSIQAVGGSVFIAVAKIEELTADRFKFRLEARHYGVDMALVGHGEDNFDISVVDDEFVKELLKKLDGELVEWRSGFGLTKNTNVPSQSIVKLKRTT